MRCIRRVLESLLRRDRIAFPYLIPLAHVLARVAKPERLKDPDGPAAVAA